ncbi:MAG: sensor histidine kinase [Verrucomicrobiota bacterium]
MFGRNHSEAMGPPPPEGVSELVFCVVDGKKKVRYRFQAGLPDSTSEDVFQFLEGSPRIVENPLLDDALKTRTSVSLALAYGEGRKKIIHILPYERKRGKWRFACLQVTTAPPDPDTAGDQGTCGLAEDRACLVLVDSSHAIHSVSSRVPETFGYAAENLAGLHLQDLFNIADVEVLQACSADTNESIMSCTFFCLDGSRREVEIKKFSTPDKYTLYGICDVSPRQRVEEFAEATARERRRIGQDLHDSIGQTLTGISLLSQSLSNALGRDGHEGSGDASQISGLADDASNQIRHISRGLMPSEIVRHGLCASLRELARVTTGSCGIACETRLDEALQFPDVAVEAHLYRIAQEAVNNAVRHSGANRIDIVVSKANGMQQLEVVDDGRWIEPEVDVIGIGLKTMEYRASAVGGRLHVGTSQQGGTQVTCRLEAEEPLAAGA